MPNQIKSFEVDQKTLDDRTFRSHLFKIITVPVAIIFVTLCFSHFEALHRDSLRDDIERLDKIVLNIVQLEKHFSFMEAAERGYVISGQETFLVPFHMSKSKIADIEDQLFKDIGADFTANTLLRGALDTYRVWVEHSQNIIAVRKKDVAKAQSLASDGSPKFIHLKENLDNLRDEVLKRRSDAIKRLAHTRSITVATEIIVTLLFILFLIYAVTRQLKDLTRSYHDLLEANFKNVAAIKEASKAKDLFLANMSHEIRTPLGAIMGFAELASLNKDLDVSTKNHISFIRRNSEHLLNLIDDLFDLSKVTADKIDIFLEDVDLLLFADDIVNLYSSRVLDKRLKLNVIIQEKIPRFIKTDPVRLKQIVSNLVGNAIKFSPNNSKVDVLFSFHDDELIVDVIDQGVGIPESMHQTIFEAFRQADPKYSRNFGGAGLGLSISKKLAHILAGDLVLIESKVNQGSHFRLRLPIKQYEQDFVNQSEMEKSKGLLRDDVSQKTNIEKVDLSNKKILLAEDSKENQILFKIFIESSKAALTIVENGTDAVRQALNNDFDLILMDIQMPGLDGYEAVRILRSSNYRKQIIALTAHTMKGEREKCLAAGFDGYLSKPISQGKLLRTIQSAMLEL